VSDFQLALLLLFGLCASPALPAEVVDGEDFIDPTRPLALTRIQRPVVQGERPDDGAVARQFEVTFVRAGSSVPIAVINDQRVTIGDTVGQATVVAIDRSGVTLSVHNQEQRVSLISTSVKRIPSNSGQND